MLGYGLSCEIAMCCDNVWLLKVHQKCTHSDYMKYKHDHFCKCIHVHVHVLQINAYEVCTEIMINNQTNVGNVKNNQFSISTAHANPLVPAGMNYDIDFNCFTCQMMTLWWFTQIRKWQVLKVLGKSVGE